MIPRSKSLFVKTFILFLTVIYCNYSSIISSDFEFDVKNLDNNQRNRLFEYLDKNRDNYLSKTEFKTLLSQLFYSTKLNKTLVNETNEETIFEALYFTKQLDRDDFNYLWDNWIKVILKPKSALIVVDVQNDFMNGSLTVPKGTVIVPVINELIQKVGFDVIVYTYDWHPSNHCSFIESAKNPSMDRKIIKIPKNRDSVKDLEAGDSVVYEKHPNLTQVLWPKHAVHNTTGAQLYGGLHVVENRVEIQKGTDPDIDSYSAFRDNGGLHNTTLHLELTKRGITDVYLSGVLYEFCVGETARDALDLRYRTAFVENAIQFKFKTLRDQKRQTLVNGFASLIHSGDVLDMVSARDRTVEMGIVLAKKISRK